MPETPTRTRRRERRALVQSLGSGLRAVFDWVDDLKAAGAPNSRTLDQQAVGMAAIVRLLSYPHRQALSPDALLQILEEGEDLYVAQMASQSIGGSDVSRHTYVQRTRALIQAFKAAKAQEARREAVSILLDQPTELPVAEWRNFQRTLHTYWNRFEAEKRDQVSVTAGPENTSRVMLVQPKHFPNTPPPSMRVGYGRSFEIPLATGHTAVLNLPRDLQVGDVDGITNYLRRVLGLPPDGRAAEQQAALEDMKATIADVKVEIAELHEAIEKIQSAPHDSELLRRLKASLAKEDANGG